MTELCSLDDHNGRTRDNVIIFVFLALSMVPAHARWSVSICGIVLKFQRDSLITKNEVSVDERLDNRKYVGNGG